MGALAGQSQTKFAASLSGAKQVGTKLFMVSFWLLVGLTLVCLSIVARLLRSLAYSRRFNFPAHN
jgi:hypothetical protein